MLVIERDNGAGTGDTMLDGICSGCENHQPTRCSIDIGLRPDDIMVSIDAEETFAFCAYWGLQHCIVCGVDIVATIEQPGVEALQLAVLSRMSQGIGGYPGAGLWVDDYPDAGFGHH